MCIKIDKTGLMNFLYSFFGGIFGGIWVAASLGQSPLKETAANYIGLGYIFVLSGLSGLLLIGFANYYIPKDWHIGKQSKRISKKTK